MPDGSSLPEIKISELPVGSAANLTDQLEANQAGTSRSITVGQVATAVAGSLPAPPTTLPPSGAASGDLAGSYPGPTIKANVNLSGSPTTTTQATATNNTTLATTAYVKANIAALPAVTVPAGSVAYGGAGGAISGVLADFAWDTVNKRLGIGTSAPTATVDARTTVANQTVFSTSGYTISGGGTAPAFNLTGTVSQASPNIDVMKMSVANPNANGGNIIRLQAGPAGTTDMFVANLAGDLNHAGISRNFYNTPPLTNGIYYYAYFLGNGAGGNIGLYAGKSNPTVDTFGGYGSIYMNLLSPGLPYYNNSGSTGWDRLVGETSTQTLTNKTITGYATTASIPTALPPNGAAGGMLNGTYPNPGIAPSGTNGQVMTTVGGVAAWATPSAGGSVTSVSVVSANGLAGTVATATTTPAITLSTSITGVLKGNGTAISAATAGTDYLTPTTQKLLQTVFTESGAVATGTTVVPYDDTIPQQTEGDQYMTLAITPQSATSKLVIEVVWIGGSSVANNIILALFQDATANALAVSVGTISSTAVSTFSIRHVMTSGTTSATTFKVRAGGNSAGTTTFNGTGGGRSFGGALASSIVIQEVLP